MVTEIGLVLASVLTTLGILAPTDPSTVAAVAVAVATLAFALIVFRSGGESLARPRRLSHAPRSIDPSTPLRASDPDSPGHARPRAPGLAASAA